MGFLYCNYMARPRKENAEYFSHDSGMRNDEKILALRSKFGNQGYAFWCMFLEILSHEEGFKKQIKTEVQKELLAGDMRVSVAEMQDILSFCSRIELLQEKDNVFWSCNLIKRLEPMVQKREFLRQKYEDKRVSTPEMPVSTAEMPQSKVKESKVKNSVNKAPTQLKDLIEPLKEEFGEKMCEEFLLYWTEKNPGGIKERWQMQKIFDPRRRLNTWKAKDWNKNKFNKTTNINPDLYE